MTSIMIVSGDGDYADPWHPFPSTSQQIADVVQELGEVTIRGDVEEALSELDGRVDLLIANIGNPGSRRPGTGAMIGLDRYVAAGKPVLAMHSSLTAFPEWPTWEHRLGGRWVRGTSYHPPLSRCEIVVDRNDHWITRHAESFETEDERYTDLRVASGATVLAHHVEGGISHPVAWLSPSGSASIALGHDLGAYRSEGFRALIRNTSEWLIHPAELS